MRKRWPGLLAALLISTGADHMTLANDKPSGAAVTLDIFSGRRNPKWTLSAAYAVELFTKLKALEVAASLAPEADNLGYQGFYVEFSGTGQLLALTVGRGMATLDEGGAKKSFIDAGAQLEAWLAKTATGHIEPDLMKIVTEQIARRR